MEYLTISEDGVLDLPPAAQTNVTIKPQTTFYLFSGLGGATLTVGVKDADGNFSAIPDGVISNGVVITHGVGAALQVKTENYTAEIKIGWTA